MSHSVMPLTLRQTGRGGGLLSCMPGTRAVNWILGVKILLRVSTDQQMVASGVHWALP